MSKKSETKSLNDSIATATTSAANTATLSVLRSNGIKDEITCSLEKTTLRDFKILISQSNILGMVPMDQQRIFHYGRELKTLGRTLQALGIGRFTNTTNKKAGPKIVIHLHAIPYPAAMMLSSDQSDMKPAVATPASMNTQRLTASTRTTRAATRTTTSSSTSTIHPTSTSTLSVSVTNPLPPTEVVELYSDDENDDVVLVVNKPTSSTSATTTTSSTTNNHSNKRRKT